VRNVPPDLRDRALGHPVTNKVLMQQCPVNLVVTDRYSPQTLLALKQLGNLPAADRPIAQIRRVLLRLAAVWLINVGVSRDITLPPRRPPPLTASLLPWPTAPGCSHLAAGQALFPLGQPVKVVGTHHEHQGLVGCVKSVFLFGREGSKVVKVAMVPSNPTPRAPCSDEKHPTPLYFNAADGVLGPILPLVRPPSANALALAPGTEGRPISTDAQAVATEEWSGLSTDGLATPCSPFKELGGWGLCYTGQLPLGRGELIGVYVARGLRTRQAHRQLMDKNALAGTHAMPVRDYVLDAAGCWGGSDRSAPAVGVALINEGPTPNVQFQSEDVDHKDEVYSVVVAVARTRILPGDVLHADYGAEYEEVRRAVGYERPCAKNCSRISPLADVESYFVNGNNDEALTRVLRWGGVQDYGCGVPNPNVPR
jgi:hypothetical protein